MNWEKGQRIFFNHPQESWIVGKIERIEEHSDKTKTKYLCIPDDTSINEVTVFHKDLHDLRGDVLSAENEDLLEVDELHEATLLRCLENRYHKDVIYTFIGPLVVSFNPFKWTIPAYQDCMMIDYIQQKKTLPHAWSVADLAFRNMINNSGNQTILVSGESGAGKTEACKTVIKYLSELSCSIAQSEEVRRNASLISQKIRESSPILEAFGNAKTKNNDNSSRFGKFIKLQFDRHGTILGADIVNYLLEKSRLITQGPNERGYHIFYQLLAGATAEEKERYKLTNATDYKCIMQGKCTKIDGVDDREEFMSVRHAMNTIGLSDQEQDAIFRVVSSILHLQNISFAAKDDGAVIDTEDSLTIAAELLKIEKEGLRSALTTRTYTIMGKDFTSPLNVEKSADARDAFSKALYNNMFNWIIWKINERICTKDFSRFIGLLDIFGFETFEVNSFEQFCINYANECLQGHYNTYTFKRDKEECIAEGIDATDITFRDNQPCIDLIQGRGGILSMLDEQCTFPKATDTTFIEKLWKNFDKKHDFFAIDRRKLEEFQVEHFAGKVSYNVRMWLEKNRDVLKPDLILLARASKCDFVSKLIPEHDESGGKKLTVAGSFKKQLHDLLGVINSTTPHWIRCIKPHPDKVPGMFSKLSTMNQLRSSGVLETIRIRREGYSARIPLDEFWKRYRILVDETKTSDYRISCDKIIRVVEFDKTKAQIGRSKVFMRCHAYTEIENIKNRKLQKSIETIQKYTRAYLARKKVWLMRENLRLQYEQEEYERYKEELLRLEKEREERERLERERRKREEAERKRLEELRRIEEERLMREKAERERIERERQEMEDRERNKLAELKRKQADRIAELERLEFEKRERERLEHERIALEKQRIEQERLEREAREMEERRLEMIHREKIRLEEEKNARAAERREAHERRQQERIKAHENAFKRKEEAIYKVSRELHAKRQREMELQSLAILAQEKLEQEKLAWEQQEWEKLQRELLIEEHRKEERLLHEKEKIKRIQQTQEQKNMELANKTKYMFEKMSRAQQRKVMIQVEREALIQAEIERRELKRKDLEKRKQEQEVLVMERQAQLQWEIDKEKRRSEMRAELKRRLKNEKLRDAWRLYEIQKDTIVCKMKSEQEQALLEAELQKKFEELKGQHQDDRDAVKSSYQFRAGMLKKEQDEYEAQLAKLKKKISGVFSSTLKDSHRSSLSSPHRSTISTLASPNSFESIKRTAAGAHSQSPKTSEIHRPSSAGSFSRDASVSSMFRSPSGIRPALSSSMTKPGTFSNLYKMM